MSLEDFNIKNCNGCIYKRRIGTIYRNRIFDYGNGLDVGELLAQQVADINSDGHLDIVGGGGNPDNTEENITVLYGTSTPGVYNTVHSTFGQYSYDFEMISH